VVFGVSQAVPGISLFPAAAGVRAQGDSLMAERAGLLVVAEKPVAPADGVERVGLARLVADGLKQAQRLLDVPERVGVAALTLGCESETLLDLSLAETVAEPLRSPMRASAAPPKPQRSNGRPSTSTSTRRA
jgi:hypothetical protein